MQIHYTRPAASLKGDYSTPSSWHTPPPPGSLTPHGHDPPLLEVDHYDRSSGREPHALSKQVANESTSLTRAPDPVVADDSSLPNNHQ